jgi:glycosyltransferase involved in cell wall biosynthesis
MIVMPQMTPEAGAEQSLAAVIPGLLGAGFRLRLVVLEPQQGLVPQIERLGVPVHDLSGRRGLDRVRALRRLIRDHRPDLVHATLFQASVPTQIASLGTGTPVLVTWASTPVGLRADGLSPFKLFAVRLVEMVAGWVSASRYHAVTHGVGETKRRELWIPRSRVRVGERGRDPARYRRVGSHRIEDFRSELGLEPNDRVVLALGRQEPQKGYVALIDAFEETVGAHPDAVLLIAGRSGSASAAIAARRDRAARPDRIRILGHRDDVAVLLAAAEVLVCSSTREGAAGAVLEAMAAGTPIVSLRLEGLEGILLDGVNARVVDPPELAAAITEVLDHPEAARQRAAAAAEMFERRFTIEASAEALGRIYHWAIAERPLSGGRAGSGRRVG